MNLPLTDPTAIVAALLAIEGLVLVAGDLPYIRAVFRYVPSMFWIYFVPIVAATLGVLPPESDASGNKITPVYGMISQFCLPASLVLLLLSVDIRAILKLGRVALGVMLAGSLGIIVGGPLVLLIFKPLMPAALRGDIWSGLGALSGSWIGGSANMITVSKMINTPQDVFSLMVIIDTIIPYSWMCLLIVLARYQVQVDRRLHADAGLTAELKARSQAAAESAPRPMTLKHAGAMFSVAGVMMFLSLWGAKGLSDWATPLLAASHWKFFAAATSMCTPKALSLILATALGIALSFTPARRLESCGASKIGYVLLYFVLASIGATTSLRHLGAAPILLLVGATWVVIHGIFILAAGRLLRAPMSLLAAASQANVGGPASTPVLAEIYLPGLGQVGLLLAVLGNIIGTPLGWLCASLCKIVNGW